MRVLCLHGYGTSGAIMRKQLDVFIRQADPSYEFVFLDGEYDCSRAKGISDFVQGPTLCFNKAFGPHDIQSSLEHLDAFIESEGPFDVIMGFSQGGSLVLTYLLQDAMAMASNSSSPDTQGQRTPLFRFAILLSTIVAFSPDPTFCPDLLSDLSSNDRAILQDFPHRIRDDGYTSLSGPPERAAFFQSLGIMLNRSLSGDFIAPDTDLGWTSLRSTSTGDVAARADLELFPGLMHPAIIPRDVRVRISTVHVVGRKDDAVLVEMSHLMERVCEPRLERSHAHDGGHDVPPAAKDVRAGSWKAVEWAVHNSMR